MSRRAIALALALVLLVGVTTGSAGLIDDPFLIAAIDRVAAFLEQLEAAQLELQRKLEEEIYNRLRGIPFPHDLFQEIRRTVGHVRGIKNEVKAMSCAWSLTPRTNLLRGLYLNPARLCKPSFEMVWGSGDFVNDVGRAVPFGGGEQEIGRLEDYVGTMTANVVSQRVHVSQGWERIFPDYFRDGTLDRRSPGEANRLEAAALAGAALVARSNNELAAQKVGLLSIADLREQYEDRRAQDLAYVLYQDLAGLR